MKPLTESLRRLPAEYEPQRAVWLTWPGNPSTWPDRRAEAEAAHAALTAAVARFQPVELICRAAWRPAAEARLRAAGADMERIAFHDWPADDAWCRDHGPLFVERGERGRPTGFNIPPVENGGRKDVEMCGPAPLEIVDFTYNAWGGKFPPWADDDAVPRRVSELRNLPRLRLPTVGEGGALEVNRRGTLITTESVWLNPNRNPGWSREEAEAVFAESLGVRETVWLPAGMASDDTDGHVDTISRFVDDDLVASVRPEASHPDAKVLWANFDRLKEGFEVVALPSPEPPRGPGGRATPATYANFLILNEAVLVPTYAQPRRDGWVLDLLRELFAGREVVGIPSEVFVREGGAVHCLTLQEPAPPPVRGD